MTAPAPSTSQRAAPAGLAAAGLAMVAWASSGVLAKGVDMDGLALVVYRMWLYAAVMAVVLWRNEDRLDGRVIKASAWGGLALGLDLAFFFSAVKVTTLASATVIAALQPVLMIGLAVPLFGEQIKRRSVSLSIVAIGGVAVVMLSSSGSAAWRPLGDLLALGALFAWTGYFIFSKRAQETISPLEYSAGTAVVAAAVNTPLAVIWGQDLSIPGGSTWFWIVLLALGPGLIGHNLMNWSLVRIPMWLGSTLTLFIPVTTSLLGWIVLGEALTTIQLVGMAVVIAALCAIVLDS